MRKRVAKLLKRIAAATGVRERALKHLWYETPRRVVGRKRPWGIGIAERAPTDGRRVYDVPGMPRFKIWRARERHRSIAALRADAEYYERKASERPAD